MLRLRAETKEGVLVDRRGGKLLALVAFVGVLTSLLLSHLAWRVQGPGIERAIRMEVRDRLQAERTADW